MSGEPRILIYGAYGYSGELIARRAVERGLKPLLGGRRPEPLQELGDELELEIRPFKLESRQIVERRLAEVDLLVHCAGPFHQTFRPMMEACLRTGTHYLDITGEIDVFESLARRDRQAEEAGVLLLPGVGFDVVPTDCLAASLAAQLPGAERLQLAIAGMTSVSRGTATTMVDNLGHGGKVRRDGEIVSVSPTHAVQTIEFADQTRSCVTIPWGDVSTAYRTTGIPDIEVYAAVSSGQKLAMQLSGPLSSLLKTAPVRAFLRSRARSGKPGPTAAQRRRGRAQVWGRVERGDEAVEGTLSTPEPYELTAHSAVLCAEKVLAALADESPVIGYATPAGAFGADLVMEIDGVERKIGR